MRGVADLRVRSLLDVRPHSDPFSPAAVAGCWHQWPAVASLWIQLRRQRVLAHCESPGKPRHDSVETTLVPTAPKKPVHPNRACRLNRPDWGS